MPMRHKIGGRLCLAILLSLPVTGAAGIARGQVAPPEPDGYRTGNYRSPVPATLAGGTVLTTDEVRRLIASGDPVLIDVLPAPRKPRTLEPDALWLPPARRNIPGGIWLPNTGFGVLPVEEEEYLRENLTRVTGADKDRALVFYCLADCWMSWNAAKRAIEWGYSTVYWYPDGTDGWAAAGLPLADSEPEPRE